MSKQKAWYEKTLLDVLATTDVQNGLSSQEVLDSRTQNGENKLEEGKKKSFIKLFLEQFDDAMILILIVAAVISAFMGEGTDAAIIMAIVILNAVLGILQENKAEKALAALKEMSAPMAKVRRNGQEVAIASKDVVVGDILLLEAGDKVAADVRLVKTSSCQIQESSLTGESVPVDKSAEFVLSEKSALGDRKNMAYASSNVTYGRAIGLVISIGMSTEVGKIASMLNDSTKEETPLQKKLNDLGKALGIGAKYVMLGGIFNKSLESCGTSYMNLNASYTQISSEQAKKYYNDGVKIYKKFRGMSTKEVQKFWNKEVLRTSEGIVKYNEVEYTLSNWIENFSDYLKTAMSYSDCYCLGEFIGGARFIRMSNNSFKRYNK